MKKKSKIIFVLLLINCLLNPISSTKGEKFKERPFVYGTQLDYPIPLNIDPHQAYASNSFDFIDQICEGLFSYDLTSPNMAIQPQLAKDFGRWQEKEGGVYGHQWTYTIELKNNIIFHDNTPLDAFDVEFSFNRLYYFCQQEPSTPLKDIYQPLKSLFPTTPYLINTTKALNLTWVEFTLNYQYVPFEALLCLSGSYILSNDPESTPTQTYYNSTTELLIGTGPYYHDSTSSSQLKLKFFQDYHGKNIPDIKEILWKFYDDSALLNEAFLNGKIDAIDRYSMEYLSNYEESDFHIVGKRKPGTTIVYLGFNCDTIDINTRKAMQAALNYSYVIDELGKGEIAQMSSIVPRGIMLHDSSIKKPVQNISLAREKMLAAIIAGEGKGDLQLSNNTGLTALSTDEEWEAAFIVHYTYIYISGDSMREGVGILAKANFAKIGIKLSVISPWDWFENTIEDYFYADILMLKWGPKYNDPSNFIYPLMSNTSVSNYVSVNDSRLEKMMLQGLFEKNRSKREILYHQMQQYIIDLAPMAYLYTSNQRSINFIGCNNTSRNPMGKLYFYLWEFDYSTISTKISSFPLLGFLGIVCITSLVLTKRKVKSTKNRAET
ncbi:ABC transporter substrate-binding protein [Candidatus Lokiarchaeum ossiferum]|uniref:ABC transporter substrate-binding protein n=1 Tax=Candidatus Lokiarchaeum ossiferum TaxID=2951803 RepID=UPI00352D27AB